MRAITSILGVLILTASVCVMAAPAVPPTPIAGQTTTIVNGANNPVPIGTVDATGAVVPVSPSAPVPVSIKSPNPLPVAVTGTSTNPLTVTNAPLQPMQYSADLTLFDDGEFGSPIWYVPAGKRFVMEFISLAIALPAGQKVGFTRLNNDDEHGFTQHVYYLLGATQDLGGAGNSVVYFVNQQVKIYVEPGHGFDFSGSRTSLSGEGSGHVAVSGYLVDIP